MWREKILQLFNRDIIFYSRMPAMCQLIPFVKQKYKMLIM